MDIRRFGIGHRRRHGSGTTRGVASQTIASDARGTISEVAFARGALLEPQLSVNSSWFLVIEGGGFVQVGDERALVAAGEAVLLPAGILHAAWTEHGQMRAILVELAGPDDSWVRGILEGARALSAGDVAKAEGRLASIPGRPGADPDEGEPD